jgi:hypothetical protein
LEAQLFEASVSKHPSSDQFRLDLRTPEQDAAIAAALKTIDDIFDPPKRKALSSASVDRIKSRPAHVVLPQVLCPASTAEPIVPQPTRETRIRAAFFTFEWLHRSTGHSPWLPVREFVSWLFRRALFKAILTIAFLCFTPPKEKCEPAPWGVVCIKR